MPNSSCTSSISSRNAVHRRDTEDADKNADKNLQAVYRDKALTALEQSHALGNRDFYTTRLDADLITIRDDPRFGKVLELEKKK